MTSEWDEEQEFGDEEEDPGFVGGGGLADALDEGDDAELDEHGDNLARVDDEEL